MRAKKFKIFRVIQIIVVTTLFIFGAINKTYAVDLDSVIEEQENSMGITDFIDEAQEHTDEVFSDINFNEILKSAISGKIETKKLWLGCIKIFGKELENSISILVSILVISIINCILVAITENFQNSEVSKIAYYVQYILIVTIALTSFSDVINMSKETIEELTNFTNLLIPILITLIATTGNISTAGMIEPILIFSISLIGNFIKNFAIPVLIGSTALGIVSKISDKVQVEKLSKRLKSAIVWIIGIILTFFVTVVSVGGNLSSNVDAVTSKTAKAAVSNLVPIVGKILGDSVDSVIGCGQVLKSSVGVVGVIAIIMIAASPIIKMLVLMAIFYIGAAICEPVTDARIVKILDLMGDTYKFLLAFLCSMLVMIIIGITLTLKISNG